MKRTLTGLAIIAILAISVPVHANLLTSPDFTSVTISYSDFVVNNALTYDEWLANGQWGVVNDGNGQGGAGDYWAKHGAYAQPIFQGITGQGPGLYSISLDYIFETGAAGATPGNTSVYMVGLNAGQTFTRFDNAPPPDQGTILYSHSLTPPSANDWTSFSDTFTVGSPYAAWVFVVWTEAYAGTTVPVPGLRGIDNASISAVPEPATMFLLGLGLIGLAGIRRTKR